MSTQTLERSVTDRAAEILRQAGIAAMTTPVLSLPEVQWNSTGQRRTSVAGYASTSLSQRRTYESAVG